MSWDGTIQVIALTRLPALTAVWGRFSSGASIHLELGEITEGAGTKNQTKVNWAIDRRATAGWDGVTC
jgi:hypothetical protein